MNKQQAHDAYAILTTLAEHPEDRFRYIPAAWPGVDQAVLTRLVDKEYVFITDGTHIQITPLGRQYALRMTNAIQNMLDFDWAERLPRAKSADDRIAGLAADRGEPYQITDHPKA